MKGYVLGFAVAAGLAGVFGACGGSYCDYGPRCPNDPKTDSQAQTICRDQYNKCANDPSCKRCIGKLQAVKDCQYNNVVCDTVTQTTDTVKSASAVAAKCSGLSDAYLTCIQTQ